MLLNIALLLLGLALLIKGSDFFVKSAARIAKSMGVSEFIIGLTLVALGTSLPELVSSIFASAKNESGLVIGTLTGANIANLALIIGMAAIIATIKTDKDMLNRDGYIMLFIFATLFLFFLDGNVSRFEGIVLILFFITYTFFLFDTSSPKNKHHAFRDFARYFLKFGYVSSLRRRILTPKGRIEKHVDTNKVSVLKEIGIMLLAGIAVVFGARFLVANAVFFAELLKLPQAMIGVFVAIGTTMPEMSVAISAAKKKLGNIVIGNAIGSCLTNSLLVMGVAATINPLSVSSLSKWFILPFMLLLGILLLFFIKTDWRIRRAEGILLVSAYLVFLALLTIGIIT